MYGLALCAGVGGLELGLKLVHGDAYRCICYVERQGFSAATLVARMEEKTLDTAPIWSDLTTFNAGRWRGEVDIITAGYPCQPFSVANHHSRGKSATDLWPSVAHVVRQSKPSYVFLENVPGRITTGQEIVKRDLEEMGYLVKSSLFGAYQFGLDHRRQRLFTLAAERPYPIGQRPQKEVKEPQRVEVGKPDAFTTELDVAERTRAIGNSVVPVVAAYALMDLARKVNNGLASRSGRTER